MSCLAANRSFQVWNDRGGTFTTIQGSGANDATTFVGTSGVDAILIQNVANPVRLTGLAANDIISIQNVSGVASGYTLLGGDGNDTIAATSTNLVSSFLNGNAGIDTFNLVGASESTVFGGQGNDTITFTSVINNTRVNGNVGIDRITTAAAFSSSVFGGQGADVIILAGQTAVSVVQGDNGNDSIGVTGSVVSSTINGNAGQDVITIGAITAFTDSTVYGGAGQDTINASTSTVAVVLSGDDDTDILVGSNFADTIFGGDGDDTITGNLLADTMTGGAGVNTYFFVDSADTGVVATGVVDVITDFENTGSATTWDLIDLNGSAGILDSTFKVSTNGVVLNTYDEALANADTLIDGTVDYSIQAVGSGTSWTAYLFTNDLGSGSTATGAIQLGTTGQFGTAALALGAISAAQIIA